MALNKEDKADVRGAMGKALANKVARITRDKKAGAYMKGIEKEIHPDLHAFKNSMRRQNVSEVTHYKHTRGFIDKYGKKD